jgi:hypothetical protein
MKEKRFRVWYKSPIDPAYTLYVYVDTIKEGNLVLNALIDYNDGLYEDGFKDTGKGGHGIELVAK